MNPLHFKQRIPSRLLRHYRSRLRTTAKHPARRPPPRMVVPNETTAVVPAAGWVPSNRSRIPPCTMRTARVMTEPIANHQVNVLRGITLTRTTMNRGITPVGHSNGGSKTCQEVPALRVSQRRHRSIGAIGAGFTTFSPRWRNIETVPFPLSAVTNPGSSTSFEVTQNVASANGPAFVA